MQNKKNRPDDLQGLIDDLDSIGVNHEVSDSEFEAASISDQIKMVESDIEALTTQLNEGVMDFHHTHEGDIFDEAIRRLEVAKRAYGITNRLRNEDERREHRSRLAGYMNKLRALINRLINKFTKPEPEQHGAIAESVEGHEGYTAMDKYLRVFDDLEELRNHYKK